MYFNFPTRSSNPLIDYFRTHAINQHKSDSMKMGNYDSEDEDSPYDPEEDLEMMFDDEDLEEMHEAY